MKLKLIRKHYAPCKRPLHDPGYTKCQCPITIRGTLNGTRVDVATKRFLREPLYRDWDAATALAETWEAAGAIVSMDPGVVRSGEVAKSEDQPTTVEDAVS